MTTLPRLASAVLLLRDRETEGQGILWHRKTANGISNCLTMMARIACGLF